MDEPTIVALLSVVASSGIAAWALWLQHESRSSSHREYLYQKQIELYGLLLITTRRIAILCSKRLASGGNRLTPEVRAKMAKVLLSNYESICDMLDKSAVILPDSVLNEAIEGFEVLLSMAENRTIRGKNPNPEDPLEAIKKSRSRLVNTVRKAIGVEVLSRDILEVIGGQ